MIEWEACVLCSVYLIVIYTHFIIKCGWIHLSQINMWKKQAVPVVGGVVDVVTDIRQGLVRPIVVLEVVYKYKDKEYSAFLADRLLTHKNWKSDEMIMLKVRKDKPEECHYLYQPTKGSVSCVKFNIGSIAAILVNMVWIYIIYILLVLQPIPLISFKMYLVILALFVSIIVENILIENIRITN